MGWTFKKSRICTALPAGYIGLCEIGCIILIFLSMPPQLSHKIKSALPENCDNSLHLLDPAMVAVTSALLLSLPGLVTRIQKEVSKLASDY